MDSKTPSFLENRILKIQNQPEQVIEIKWKNYENLFAEYGVVERVYSAFPLTITRNKVSEIFVTNNDLVFSSVAAMIWGGIDQGNLKKLLNDQHFEEKLKKVSAFLDEGRILESFEFMQPRNPGKLPGIDYAYFTKILFFLGQMKGLETKPLIFDKWTNLAFFCMKLDIGEYDFLRENYESVTIPIAQDKVGSVRPRVTGVGFSRLYMDYVDSFNSWANHLKINPSELETFLFGSHLGKDKSPNNVRRQLWSMLLSKSNFILPYQYS